MVNQETMTLEDARERMNPVPAPDFWVGSWETHQKLLSQVRSVPVTEIARSPGGRPLHLLTYGEKEAHDQRANFSSACAAGMPEAFCDRAQRKKPVVFLVGPIHGHEVEGLTGLLNLISLLETGTDLAGNPRPQLVNLAEQCRLVIIPCGNPDGVARFEPDSLVGAEFCDLRFWGQGTRRDHRLWGWPECKQLHPMLASEVGFMGCYFNDSGVNPGCDDFFSPMSTEVPAVVAVAQAEAPDWVAFMHSYPLAPGILRSAWLPLGIQKQVEGWSRCFGDNLKKSGFEINHIAEAESGVPENSSLTLTPAIYHACGAVAATYESTHGLKGKNYMDHAGILETQFIFLESAMKVAIDAKAEGPC